jgi:hypothetical protein
MVNRKVVIVIVILNVIVSATILFAINIATYFNEKPGEGKKSEVIYRQMIILVNSIYRYKETNGKFPQKLKDISFPLNTYEYKSENTSYPDSCIFIRNKNIRIEYNITDNTPMMRAEYTGPGRNTIMFNFKTGELNAGGYF